MRAFLRDFGVSMQLTPYGNSSEAHIAAESVIIERDTLVNMWCNVFHELCHIICAREGIFPLYHSMGYPHLMTKAHKLAVRRTGLRAEVYVDKMAEKIFQAYFPDLTYNQSYRTWQHKAWHQAWLEEVFK